MSPRKSTAAPFINTNEEHVKQRWTVEEILVHAELHGMDHTRSLERDTRIERLIALQSR